MQVLNKNVIFKKNVSPELLKNALHIELQNLKELANIINPPHSNNPPSKKPLPKRGKQEISPKGLIRTFKVYNYINLTSKAKKHIIRANK